MTTREVFTERMAQCAIGARLGNYNVGSRAIWTVIACKRWDTNIQLTLRCGRRQISRSVMICESGPDLASSGLRFIGHAPHQRELLGATA